MRGEASLQTNQTSDTYVQRGPVWAKAVHPRNRPPFTKVLVIFLKSDTIPSTITGRLFLQVTRSVTPRSFVHNCAHGPWIGTPYRPAMLMREAGAGGWQLWGPVTPVAARANSAVNIISHPRSGDKVPFDS